MPATVDLWPNFTISPKPRGIRQMLEEAGSGLKVKTNGIVAFRVWPIDNDRNRKYPFRFRCDLHVEKLDYNFPLLYVDASATGFPAEVQTDIGGTTVPDESTLFITLEAIFHSDTTKAIIENLISMATE
jgi:hypothetical protein